MMPKALLYGWSILVYASPKSGLENKTKHRTPQGGVSLPPMQNRIIGCYLYGIIDLDIAMHGV